MGSSGQAAPDHSQWSYTQQIKTQYQNMCQLRL